MNSPQTSGFVVNQDERWKAAETLEPSPEGSELANFSKTVLQQGSILENAKPDCIDFAVIELDYLEFLQLNAKCVVEEFKGSPNVWIHVRAEDSTIGPSWPAN